MQLEKTIKAKKSNLLIIFAATGGITRLWLIYSSIQPQ